MKERVLEIVKSCSEVDPEITKVTGSLERARAQAFERCEPGLMQHVRDKRLSPDKEERKMRAYGAVLALLREGALRDDDLHAIKVDWSDSLSRVGAWQRG